MGDPLGLTNARPSRPHLFARRFLDPGPPSLASTGRECSTPLPGKRRGVNFGQPSPTTAMTTRRRSPRCSGKLFSSGRPRSRPPPTATRGASPRDPPASASSLYPASIFQRTVATSARRCLPVPRESQAAEHAEVFVAASKTVSLCDRQSPRPSRSVLGAQPGTVPASPTPGKKISSTVPRLRQQVLRDIPAGPGSTSVSSQRMPTSASTPMRIHCRR